MNNSKPSIIYLMGAGRSGTTAIATFLGAHPKIHSLGEMHQFFGHLRDQKPCSCGEQLLNCSFWSEIIAGLPESMVQDPAKIQKANDRLEFHSALPRHFLGLINKNEIKTYNSIQEELFKNIAKNTNAAYLLDSAKYIGRNLSLSKSKKLSIKTVYIIRDVRGLINSFSKNVQSSRTPLSTIIYYLSVNLTASVVALFFPKGSVLKLKYEDFMGKPKESLNEIGNFLQLEMNPVLKKVQKNEAFEIGHFIGGNRLKNKKKIRFDTDQKWKDGQTRVRQVLYYILAAPIMILYRYKI